MGKEPLLVEVEAEVDLEGEKANKEGDVIGFYINMPDGEQYAPKSSQ